MEKQKLRNEIDIKDTWDLTPIFKTKKEFLNNFEEVKKEIDKVDKYKGNITKSAKDLYDFLVFSDEVERKVLKLYYYASLSYDADTTNSESQKLHDMIDNLYSVYEIKTSFITPELYETDYSKILEYIKEYPKLGEYSFALEKIYRYQPHTLDKKSEELLSNYSKVRGTGLETYQKLTNSDFKFGTLKLDGKEVELTESNYSLFLQNKDREVRREAFKEMYRKYSEFKNTIFSTFKLNMNEKIINAKVRNYPSAIEASLFQDNVDKKLYDNIIDAVHENMDKVYNYFDLRKRVLGLDEISNYDTYVNMIEGSNKHYTYEEAQKEVKEALKPLGSDYQKLLDRAFSERWIDVYNNKGKRGGAYSSGFYDTYPYVLLNFEGTWNSVSTIAHELGHSMHTYYSCQNNPYQYSIYSIFVAEVASTVNELLLAKHKIATSKDKKEKASILSELLELFKATIYRQTMFAEFERDICEKLEKDIPVTVDDACDMYYKLNEEYFGKNFTLDNDIRYEWLRIPHFYYNFYVYKYALGLSCACKIVDNILSGKDKNAENYKKFLSAGSSVYPVDALKLAGVDPTSKDTISSALKMFEDFINEFKEIINEKKSDKQKVLKR